MGKALFWVVAFLGGLLATRVLAQVAAKKMYNDSLPKQGGTQRTVEAEAMVYSEVPSEVPISESSS